jgi:hypothetical protein
MSNYFMVFMRDCFLLIDAETFSFPFESKSQGFYVDVAFAKLHSFSRGKFIAGKLIHFQVRLSLRKVACLVASAVA